MILIQAVLQASTSSEYWVMSSEQWAVSSCSGSWSRASKQQVGTKLLFAERSKEKFFSFFEWVPNWQLVGWIKSARANPRLKQVDRLVGTKVAS